MPSNENCIKYNVKKLPFVTPEIGVDRRIYVVLSEIFGVTRVGDGKPIES